MKIILTFIILFICTHIYAESFSVSNKILTLTVNEEAVIEVKDNRNGYIWKTSEPVNTTGRHFKEKFQDIKVNKDKKEIAFNMMFSWDNKNFMPCYVILKLDISDKPYLEAIMPAHKNELNTNIPFIEGFVSENVKDGVLVVSENSTGHLYPLNMEKMIGETNGQRNLTYHPIDRLDMAFVGVSDMKTGIGYSMIIDTSDDGILRSTKYKLKENESAWAPMVLWTQSMEKMSYDRKLIFYFENKDGYVGICKNYREYLKKKGYIVTLKEKKKNNPNVEKLYGAISVWGYLTKEMADDMKAKGVKHALIQRLGDWVQETPQSEDITYINNLGYLTGEYDNYADMYPIFEEMEFTSGKYADPLHAVIQKDGSKLNGWFDGTMFCQKRCPSKYTADAKVAVSNVLKKSPYTARFFDVLTAQDLFECYDPNHKVSKTDTRKYSENFFKEMKKEGLVVGGEHGIWWAVPFVDYFEGMMSSPVYAWSASYLSHPKEKTPQSAAVDFESLYSWEDYDKWGIGYYYKAPLWELVFHDCVVNTWYWGDSNDWLMVADFENIKKKNLLNILYGTMPMAWSAYDGSYEKNKDVFYEIYNTVTPVTTLVAEAEMVSHEFLNNKREVQKTSFSNGIEIIVNFGKSNFKINTKGKELTVKPEDFVVVK